MEFENIQIDDSRESSPDITGEIDDDPRSPISGGDATTPMSPRIDSDSERPLSSTQMTQSVSHSGSMSAGSPSPNGGCSGGSGSGARSRTPQNSTTTLSPTTSNKTDSPIEVGGPISLTSRTPTITTPSFGNHIFSSFSDR